MFWLAVSFNFKESSVGSISFSTFLETSFAYKLMSIVRGGSLHF